MDWNTPTKMDEDKETLESASQTGTTVEEEYQTYESPPPSPKPKKVYKYPGFWKTDPVDAPIFGLSRHSFQGPLKFQKPNACDLVYWKALEIVEEHQSDKPFEKFVDELLLSALNCAPTIFFSYYETEPVVHCLFSENMVVKVQLKAVCDLEIGWSSCTVLVRDGDRWIGFRDFLKTGLWKLHDQTLGQVGYWIQHRWWKSLKKPFRLMDLPAEIRNSILLYGMGEQVLPSYNVYDDTMSIIQGSGPKQRKMFLPDPHRILPPRIPATNLSVLCLSKDLRDTLVPMLWNDTTKVFRDAVMLSKVCQPMIPTANHFIRRMKLELSMRDLFDLFEVNVLPFTVGLSGCTSNVIKDLRNLMFLEIEFRQEDWTSPWHETNHPGLDFAGELGAAGLDCKRAPCQQILIDMIMTFAAPQLQSVKTVRLTGLLKTCTKQKWEQLLNKTSFSEYADRIEGWKKSFTEMKYHELPPRCKCNKLCTHSISNFDYDDIAESEDRTADYEQWELEHGWTS